MKHWTIKTFITTSGKNVIKKWLKNQPIEAQAYINSRLRYLETQKIWNHRPYSAKRKGSNHIYEVIITRNKVQYRPLGFFGANLDEFTLLVGAKERDWKLEPIDADEIAEKRRELILKDGKYAIKYFNDI